MNATAMVALLLLAQQSPPAPGASYADIVRLENRASRENGRPLALDYKLAIEIAQKLGRPRLMAVLSQRLGRRLESVNIQQAVIAYESGLSALRGDPTLNVDEALRKIASLPKGYPGVPTLSAADLYSESIDKELQESEADPLLVPQFLIDIGNAYFAQPQFNLALARYKEALARPEIAAAPKLRAYALANSGEILRALGSTDKAEQDLLVALDLLKHNAPALETRRALAMLGGIYRDRGQEAEALAKYNEALALYAMTNDPRGEGRAYAGLGLLHLKKKQFAEAKHAYARATELGEKANDATSLWHAYWGLGRAQHETGDLVNAAVSLQKSLDRIEDGQRNLTTDEGKVALLDSVQDAFDELISLYLEQSSNDPAANAKALQVSERARAGAMRELMGGSERGEFQCQASPQANPGERARQGAPGLESPMAQMAPAIRSGISQRAPATQAPDPRCEEGRDKRSATPPAMAQLVFHVLSDRTAVFAVSRRGDVRVHTAPIGRDDLTHRVAEFRDALGVDSTGRGVAGNAATPPAAVGSYHDAARALYRDLVEPLAGAFADGETLVIEPHGPLWLVPFAALEDAGGRPVIDRWPLLHSPSAEVLEEIRSEPSFSLPRDVNALIVGNPTAPTQVIARDDRFRGALRATFEPLPGAEREARAISALLPKAQKKLLIGSEATREAVETEMASHTVIHLASHALAFSDKPTSSFVMLAARRPDEGKLTVARVLNLSIRADLVTLSACQTGMGYLSGDGVIGLSRAFLVRGARSVMVSQWSVSDTATEALMKAFYGRYLFGSEDKARSLQKAMNEVRRLPAFADAKLWAPFVLIGSEK